MRKLPHSGVYTRLKPSKIHGVGVFAIKDIKKDTYVFPEDDDRMTWIDAQHLRRLPEPIKELYEDFSIIKGKKHGQPRNFNALTTSWYLNHSDTPNMAADRSYRFYALRDIPEGEELTIDYRTYSDEPKGVSPLRRRSKENHGRIN
ncbi:MAG: SET domain-containing protein [Candidatus Binatus sp.]